MCDENTIGVVAIMGSTYDGSYEPVAALSDALDDLADRTDIDVPIHVDGASGGFVAPFLPPDLVRSWSIVCSLSCRDARHNAASTSLRGD